MVPRPAARKEGLKTQDFNRPRTVNPFVCVVFFFFWRSHEMEFKNNVCSQVLLLTFLGVLLKALWGWGGEWVKFRSWLLLSILILTLDQASSELMRKTRDELSYESSGPEARGYRYCTWYCSSYSYCRQTWTVAPIVNWIIHDKDRQTPDEVDQHLWLGVWDAVSQNNKELMKFDRRLLKEKWVSIKYVWEKWVEVCIQ